MKTDLEKIIDTTPVAPSQEDTLFKSVLKTSLKTITFLFLITLLSVSYFFMRFPYHAMKLYMDFSMYENALVYCERAINQLNKEKYNDIYTESLLNGIELSDMLLMDTNNLKFAKKLSKFTQIYAQKSDFDAVNSRIDEFYHSQITQTISTISLNNALSLFSYKDYVYTTNQYARIRTNNTGKMLFNGALVDVLSITPSQLSQLSANDLAVFFNQIALNPSQETYQLVLDALGSYLNTCTNSSGLNQLYLLKAAQNIHNSFMANFSSNTQEINTSFLIEGQAINDYYTQKLEQFR